MSKPPKTVFTNEDLVRWAIAFDSHIPQTPTKAECLLAPEARSFQAQGRRLGIILRFESDTGQPMTFSLNPVTAKYLAEALLKAGINHGWMNSHGNITFPLADD